MTNVRWNSPRWGAKPSHVAVVADVRLDRVRLLVALYSTIWCAVRLPHHLELADLPDERWVPVGVLGALDAPPAGWLAPPVLLATVVLGVAAARGRAARAVLPMWAVGVLLTATWGSSWGQLFHTENLLVLHAGLLALAAVVRLDATTTLRAMAVVTAAAYVVAGIAKLRISGWDWIAGDVLRDQVAFDNLRKAVLGAPTSPLGTRLVDVAWPWPALALATTAVELGAPLALLGRRAAAWWSGAAWLFHVGVLALMAIGFPYQLAGVAFAPLLPVERLRLPNVARRWTARLATAGRAAAAP
jgi:hypothetical protein